MYAQLDLRPDGGEQLLYNHEDFPVRCVAGDLSSFLDYSASCHWHNDFEILMPTDGDLAYFVNGRIVPVKQGQAIFINANRLHYGFSPTKTECLYICLVFHPDIFMHPYLQNQVKQISGDESNDYFLLNDRQVLDSIRELYRLYNSSVKNTGILALSACAQLLFRIGNQEQQKQPTPLPDSAWISLRQMVGYLQTHYDQQIRLEDIAAAGAVCRSKCCKLFREKMNTTPTAYLNRYRLEKAKEHLLNQQDSITEIAHKCGFYSPSYFSDQFRKLYGMSPRQMQQSKK